MKKRFRIFCLILVFMLINTSCVKRRYDELEARRTKKIVSEGNFDPNSSVFYPDNIDRFDVDAYLAWYKDLDKAPKLQLPPAETPKALTNQEMIDDFNYVFKELEENYPFFDVLKRQHNIDFIGNYNKYLKRISECANDDEFIDTMTGIMGELNNHHARIADRAYVERVVDYYSKNWNSPSIYFEFLNLNKQVVRNRYNLTGMQSARNFTIEDRLAIAMLGQSTSSNLTLDTSKEGIAILKINSMADPSYFEKDLDTLNTFLQNKHLYKALIIDIRENYGGNMEYWRNFLLPKLLTSQKMVTNHLFFKDSERAKLILADDTLNVENLSNVDVSGIKLDHPNDLKKFDYYIKDNVVISPDESDKDYGYSGDIYLLVDGAVFSAAEGMASFMKHSGSATLIGEQTGGDGITLGIINDVMPHSGLVFTYTNTLGYAPDGSINEEKRTLPDIQSSSYRNSLETIEEIEAGNY